VNLAPNKSTYVKGVPDHFVISYIADIITELPFDERSTIIFALLGGEDPSGIINDCVVESGSDEITAQYKIHCIDNDAECRDDFTYEEDGSGNP